MNIDDIIENAQLKGRIIALDAEVKCLEAVIRAHERVDCLQVKDLKAENARLKTEVERLRRLGTEMGKHLPDTDEANRAYIDFEAGGKP